jgi:enoyl-CoA hydratase/carnithine racemase
MDASNYETILTSLDDGVLTITMNRPGATERLDLPNGRGTSGRS